MKAMNDLDEEERDLLGAFDKGKLKSVDTKRELAKFKAATRATAMKDKRKNIRLSSDDLSESQVRALPEGIHKYVTGRLSENKQK
jgi:predicted DNA binding CopG/RHH family protein